MLEVQVENYLCQRVVSYGGLCDKFQKSGRRGVPDRIVTLPPGKVYFVELKRPGEKPDPHQIRDHARRKLCGVEVHVIDSFEAVDNFMVRWLMS
jgi:hypothetical protein